MMMRWYVLCLGLCMLGCERTSETQASNIDEQKPNVERIAAALKPAVDLDPRPHRIHVALTAKARSESRPGFSYAYNDVNPGPLIRGKVGDWLTVTLQNELPNSTTIHWHGLKVPFEMDGVTWRQDPVPPGGQFRYSFQLKKSGTFWYHPHFDTERQVDGGLYGALVVEDPSEPTLDDELVLLFDTQMEFDRQLNALPDGLEGRPAHGHGRRKSQWLVNGVPAPYNFVATGGSRVRVRIINVSNVGYLSLSWPEIRQIAGDQGLLPSLQEPDSLLLAPGDRVEVEWLVGASGFDVVNQAWSLNGGPSYESEQVLVNVTVNEPAPAPSPAEWPFIARTVSPDPMYTDIYLTMTGSDRTGIWLLNGERFPDVTIHSLDLGQEAIIEVRNVSPTEHPFHLHGLDFEVLSVNGKPPTFRRIEDTINLRVRDRVRLKVKADNPGFWMAHCHILPHAYDGMMSIIEVKEN